MSAKVLLSALLDEDEDFARKLDEAYPPEREMDAICQRCAARYDAHKYYAICPTDDWGLFKGDETA